MTVQYLQEQADRAVRLARGVLDSAASEALMKYALECRERANVAAPFATDQDTTIHPMIGSDSVFYGKGTAPLGSAKPQNRH
jgi:hypothetical protein